MDQRQPEPASADFAQPCTKIPLKWRVLSIFVLFISVFSCIRFLNTAIALILAAFSNSDLSFTAIIFATASFSITILGSLPFSVFCVVIAQKLKKTACKHGLPSKLISFVSVFSIIGLVLVCIHCVVTLGALWLIY